MTSRFGFTGEYYAQETGMWHLRARDLHPGLGRFLSADPVQPCPEGSQPGTQGYNRYAYVANNPTTWVDPSGYSVEPLAADLALLGMMYAMRGGFSGILRCALDEECREMKALMGKLGSRGANYITWTAEELQRALFSTYPHQPTPVDPGLLVLSVGLSNVPIWGDLYDLYSGVTGYDPITKQYLAGWERGLMIVGLIPLPGISGHNLRGMKEGIDQAIKYGDEVGTFLRSSSEFMGVERAAPELIAAIRRKGRTIEFAVEGSEELRFLNYIGAEANVGGETVTHILLRENPSKAAVLEEFLHGTQHKAGIINKLGVAGAERHVKDFMIRHRTILGLTDEDVEILQVLMNAGL